MSNILEFIIENLPPTSADDILRFTNMADIQNVEAFATELDLFIRKRIESIPRFQQRSVELHKQLTHHFHKALPHHISCNPLNEKPEFESTWINGRCKKLQ